MRELKSVAVLVAPRLPVGAFGC